MPGTSYSWRIFSTWGVQVGFGPSSKVSAIVLSGTETVVAWPPWKVRIGPPSRTLSGTLPALAPVRTRWSPPTSARR